MQPFWPMRLQGYKNVFGVFTPDATLTEPLSDIAMSQEDPPKTIAILSRNDLFPLAIATEASKSAEKRGIKVVYFEKYPVGATDLSPALIAMKGTNADWMFITGYAKDLILEMCIRDRSLGLAPIVVDTLIEAVSTIREEGTTIVIVEQDVGAALQLADRGYVLEHGRIVLEGPAESLQANEHVREAYLGL